MLAVGLFLHFALSRGCGEAAGRALAEVDLRTPRVLQIG